ncbi:uncharacterized protein LOC134538935 [Bacillus rossius redtenbacheri]|uniref:uncharacterized protein LOC134538935 n=1 Tax=Bacillus rossius redtenbacheri TaxID=93214 RepID=UPI002FDCDFB2
MEAYGSEVSGQNVSVQEAILPPGADFSAEEPSSTKTLAPQTPVVSEQQSAVQTMRQQTASYIGAAPMPFTQTHLDGINLDDPAASTGGRVQKPRSGARGPSRALTSQIVTQDEIAKELLERTLKKYTVPEFPEGGDYFFAWKLTQRLANRLAPVDTSPTKMEQEASSGEFPVSSAAIPDDKELLAILEGDGINDWMPETKPAPKPPPAQLAQPMPFKLDPELERQLALKQLMEMPIRTKRKKPNDKKEKQPRKPRIKKKNKDLSNRAVLQNSAQKGSQASANMKKVRRKRTDVSEPLAKKLIVTCATRGKAGGITIPKLQVKQSLSNGEVHTSVQRGAVHGTAKSIVAGTAAVKGRASHPQVSNCTGPRHVTKTRVPESGQNLSLQDGDDRITLPKPCSTNTMVSCDIPMVPSPRLAAPPRTYGSPKKRTLKSTDGRSAVQHSAATVCYNETKDTAKPKEVLLVKTEPDEKSASVDCVGNDGGKKKNRMREVDRLLMDEGAINLLYEAEQGESKRRSGLEKVSAGQKRPISPLKSIRRKKKDLLLKTRLVKNAVMRLSSSPSSAGPLALRAKRPAGHSLPLPVTPPQRKPSLDSQGSMCSPSPTPSLPCSPRLQLPAEASRIIRRHSSSSNFSSRSTSPMRRPSIDQEEPLVPAPIRKKGVPIFVRKTGKVQTYLGKQKPVRHKFLADSGKAAVQMAVAKLQEATRKQADVRSKGSEMANGSKKINSLDKQRLKAQMARNFHRGVEKGKLLKMKRGSTDDKRGKKSLSSSPCSSRSSSVPLTPSAKKEVRMAVPISPGAASYSELVHTLESQRRDDHGNGKQRSSVRQNTGSYHYRELCLRRHGSLVQLVLAPVSTRMKNAFNVQVLRELREVLQQLRKDEGCRAVLLTSAGGPFCQGIDLSCLLHAVPERRRAAALELSAALKEFVRSLALFPKPLVAGVQGAALGLGVTMLPLFDMVLASDTATFHTPYARLGQVPEGGAVLTLPHLLGGALTSELLFGCRKLTATEARQHGLVTRVLWPDKFQEELLPLVRQLAAQSSQAMEATKALLRHGLRAKLDAALDSEAQLLVQHWSSAECQEGLRRFLELEEVSLQRQRFDP